MKQWFTLFQKELTEISRNKKWIWVPLVFLLIAIMDPLTYHFLPQLIEISGGLPEGAVFKFPDMLPNEVLAASLKSLSSYGVIILALFTMGTISGEQKSGVNEMILVRPVNYGSYISSKWVAHILLLSGSLVLSIALSWYYINLLFGKLPFTAYFMVLLLFTLWFAFFLSLSIFYNVLFKTPGVIAACTIATYFLLNAINIVVDSRWPWFPNKIFSHIDHFIVKETVSSGTWGVMLVLILLIVLLLSTAIGLFKQKQIAS